VENKKNSKGDNKNSKGDNDGYSLILLCLNQDNFLLYLKLSLFFLEKIFSPYTFFTFSKAQFGFN
jgi:hypothetical protein